MPDLIARLCEQLEWTFPEMIDLEIETSTNPTDTFIREIRNKKGKIPLRVWQELTRDYGLTKRPRKAQLEVHPCDAYTVVRAFDEALGDLYVGGSTSEYDWVWSMLNEDECESSLTTDPHDFGWMLPRGPRDHHSPTRGQFLRAHFTNFFWARPVPSLSVQLHRLEETDEIRREPSEGFRVAFLPAIDIDDVEFQTVEQPLHEGKPTFEVPIKDAREQAVAERICAAIDDVWIDVDLLVLPELACTENIWEAVRNHLGNKLMRNGRHLKLVMLGSAVAWDQDREVPRNRALLVNDFGEELFFQDKMHRYEMHESEIERYGLTEYLDPDHGRHEEHASIAGRCLKLCDSEVLGRFAILICEDYAHLEPAATAAIRLGVDLLICPVMDGEFKPYRWVANWAEWYEKYSSVQTISVNSLVLPPRHRGDTADDDSEPFGIGLVAKGIDPTKHGVHIVTSQAAAEHVITAVKLSVNQYS